jgi:outer membrane protein
MKRITLLCGVFCGFWCLSGLVNAEVRIGYLDVTRVAEESPQYKAARESLQNELQRRETDLRNTAEQLKNKESQLQRDAAVMSETQMKRAEREVIALRRKLQNSRDEYRDELSLRQNEERTKLLRQVAEVVKEIGKAEQFDLILTEGVAYASRDVDISDKVLARLKQGFRSR